MKIINKLVCFVAVASLVAGAFGGSAMAEYWTITIPEKQGDKLPVTAWVGYNDIGEDLTLFPPLFKSIPGKLLVQLEGVTMENLGTYKYEDPTPDMFPGIDIERFNFENWKDTYEKYGLLELILKEKTEDATLNAWAILKDSPNVKDIDNLYVDPWPGGLFAHRHVIGAIQIHMKDFKNIPFDDITPEMFPGIDIKRFLLFADKDKYGGYLAIVLKETTDAAAWKAIPVLWENPLVDEVSFIDTGRPLIALFSETYDPHPKRPDLTVVTGLETTNISTDSIALKWQEVPSATSYTLLYNGKAATTYEPSITLNGLAPGTNYEIKVFTRRLNEVTEWSDTISATTKTVATTIFSPTVTQSNFNASLANLLTSILKSLLANGLFGAQNVKASYSNFI